MLRCSCPLSLFIQLSVSAARVVLAILLVLPPGTIQLPIINQIFDQMPNET